MSESVLNKKTLRYQREEEEPISETVQISHIDNLCVKRLEKGDIFFQSFFYLRRHNLALFRKQRLAKTVMSAPSHNKIWDGYLKLNSALTVSTIASFKSGEKMPNVNWTETVEVKGKVKLHDFEIYIQDLKRSPKRGLMVAKKYVEDGRVGLAKVKTGIDLYVCPCSDTIITLLAKYGFFKSSDKITIDHNKDYLIACVVWKRSQINHPNFVPRKSSESSRTGNTSRIHLWSMMSQQSKKKDPIEVWSPIRTPFESPPKNAPYKKYLSSFSALIKSDDTPNVLPSISVSAELEASNPDLILRPAMRPELEFRTSTTCDQNFHKRKMEEDMDISPQKKVCYKNDNDNMSNMQIIHYVKQNFIPPSPAAQIHPPFPKQKPDFTYLGPILMREQAYSHAKPDYTCLTPILMREQTQARVDSKPDFTYLGPGFTREQAHAQA